MRHVAFLLSLLCIVSAKAQTLLDGVVLDKNNAPIARAIVRVLDGEKTLAFTTAKTDGSFVLAVTSEADSLNISAEKMSYAKEVRRIANRKQSVKFILKDSFTQLKEVVVKAPAIVQKGDTLRFNLSAFLGKGDVSLEDALKKVPGITIDDGGTIKYNGKAISNFYVEGLEMLGGNYTLMTKNLPAEHVASVEVLENHNEARMDKGKVSDRVALNVRLKNSALLRPIGTTEAAIGASEDRILYTLGTTGMFFAKKFQATVSVKTGNIEDFAENQTEIRVIGYGRGSDSPNALKAGGELSGERPPLDENRYSNIDDRLVTANTITKLSEEKTLRVNTSYAYHKERNEAATTSEYFLGSDNWLRLEQNTDALSRYHSPKMNINYTLNADKKYVRNDLRMSGRFAENLLPTEENKILVSQKQRIDYFSVANSLNYRVRIGKREWNARTDVSWTKAPSVRLDIASEHSPYNAQQKAVSQTLDFEQHFSTSFIFGHSEIRFPFAFLFKHNTLDTELQRNTMAAARNDLDADFGEVNFNPSYQFTSKDKRYDFAAYLKVRGVVLKGDNAFDKDHTLSLTRLYVDPNFRFTYTASAASRWNLNGSYAHSQGDLLSLLTQPVMTNYRNTSARSGILAQSARLTAGGSYDYKNPITMWFASVGANYSNTKQNLLSSRYITDDTSSSTALRGNNHTQTVSSNADLSKGVQEINSKFTVFANWSWNESRMIQQNIPMTYYNTSLYGGVQANLRPYRWMEAYLSASWGISGSRYASVRNSYREFDSNARLSVFLPKGFSLSAKSDYSHLQLSDGKYKDLALFDLSATYKHKQLRFKLSANNLLNQRHYRYTVNSGLDTHSYDYTLRPRELVFSIIYTK